MINTLAIDSFWNWFIENRDAIGKVDLSNFIINEMESQLYSIGNFDWEIGPGRNKLHFFAISPAGDPDYLNAARTVISAAPNLTDWEFYPAKPPRDWDLKVELQIDNEIVAVDCKRWEFVLYKFSDGVFDLLFIPHGMEQMPRQVQYFASTILLDGEIGEANRIELIREVEIVSAWSEKQAKFARKVEPGLIPRLLGVEIE
jgi:hypothetical protein